MFSDECRSLTPGGMTMLLNRSTVTHGVPNQDNILTKEVLFRCYMCMESSLSVLETNQMDFTISILSNNIKQIETNCPQTVYLNYFSKISLIAVDLRLY